MAPKKGHWEGGVIRSDGFTQVGQCVPVSDLAGPYRVVVSGRGDGGTSKLAIGVYYYQGSCGGIDVGTDGVFHDVGPNDFEEATFLFTPPAPVLGPDLELRQVHVAVVVFNENVGAPLILDSVRLERPGCGVDDDAVACAHGGRFEVKLDWQDFTGGTGRGQLVTQATDSSLWWFFGDNNWEMLVKVLRGCELGGHWWVFAAGATNVQWLLTVKDTSTGQSWTYLNPLGQRSPAVTETAAFECAPD